MKNPLLEKLQRFVGLVVDMPPYQRLRWGLLMPMLNHAFTGMLLAFLYLTHTGWGWFAGSERFIDYSAAGHMLLVWIALFLPYPLIYLGFRLGRSDVRRAGVWMTVTIFNIVVAVTYSLHAVGSVSNVAMLMYPLVALLTTLLFGIGWGFFTFFAGFSVYGALLALETAGRLPYAPIFTQLGRAEFTDPIYVGLTLAWLLVNSFAFVLLNAGLFHSYLVQTRRRGEELALRFSHLVDRSPVPVLVAARNGIRFANEAAARLAGARSANELVGRDVFAFIPDPSSRLSLLTAMDLPSEDARAHRLRLAWVGKAGVPLEVEATVVPIPAFGPGAVQLALRNLTEELKAEREKLAIMGSQMGLWDWDLTTDKVIWNEPWARTMGFPTPDVPSGIESWRALIHPEDWPGFQRALEDHLEGRAAFLECEYRMARGKGRGGWRWVQTRGKAVEHDAQGQARRLVGTQLDVSDRVSLEAEVSKVRRLEALGRLAGGVAHDFNNLLTGITGYTEILLLGLSPGDPMHGDLMKVKTAADRATALTGQLLAFGRRQAMDPRVLDLNQFLSSAETMLKRLVGEDIQLVLVPGEELARVKVDPSHLEQVLINLAVNARDAMPNGGKLTVKTANAEIDSARRRTHPDVQPGRYVVLAVSDNGCGMAPEVKEHLFEPFFTTKGSRIGIGLGLPTIYGVVKQSGGFINVYSEVGSGTALKTYLPQVNEEITSEKRPRLDDLPRGQETIFLVEDEEVVRTFVQMVLEQQGYQVVAFEDGAAALAWAKKGDTPFDLLLTDMVMPIMGGPQLCEGLRQIIPGVKVLYMSGYPGETFSREGVLEEDAHFLEKPFTMGDLVRRVRWALDEGRGPADEKRGAQTPKELHLDRD